MFMICDLRFCVYWCGAWGVGAWLVNVRKMGWGQEDPETPSPTVPFPRPKWFQNRVTASLGTVTHSWCPCCFCRLCLQAQDSFLVLSLSATSEGPTASHQPRFLLSAPYLDREGFVCENASEDKEGSLNKSKVFPDRVLFWSLSV